MGVEFEGIGAFGTEVATRNRRIGVALDGDHLSIFMEDQLPTSHSAIRTDGAGHLGVLSFRGELASVLRPSFRTGSVAARANLFHHRPALEQIFKHEGPPQ